MKQVKSLTLLFGLSVITGSLFLLSATSQAVDDCSPRCWNPVTRLQTVPIVILLSNVYSENNCKALCANNGTCIGIYWSSSIYQCWFQMPGQSVTTGVNYWSLSSCTDDCLSYCWKPVLDHANIADGTKIMDVADENNCKLRCSENTSCTGVDWDPTVKPLGCFLFYNSSWPTKFSPDCRHWNIIQNLSTECHTATSSTTNSATSTSPAAINAVTWERTAVIVLAVLLGLSVLLNMGLIIMICIRGRCKPEEQWNEEESDCQDLLEEPRNEAESNKRDLPEVPRHEAKSNYHHIPEVSMNEAESNYNYQGLYVQEKEFDNNGQVSDYADLEVDRDYI